MLVDERFWSRVSRRGDGECWEWTASLAGGGYGACYTGGRQRPAHRVAYEVMRGPIPDGFDLDHLCRNRKCVNPAHLEPVTRRENLLRSPVTITALNAAKTECVNGHEFTPENTMILKNGTRRCRVCRRASSRRARARKAA